ncbi:MAG: DUF2290 domain-containing protein [Candidatus Sumerlaeota bacterium]|nr:DUF2290 domain-containing protein [Candidatus Sumerlaeota bacterium]
MPPNSSAPNSFSTAADNLLDIIRPYNRPESAFPTGLDATVARRQANESLHQWFRRLVDRYCSGQPELARLEDDIALFAKLKWNHDQLYFASIQVLVVADKIPLADYYLDDSISATSLRLDLNYETLGKPFTHPLPHIHVGTDESLRFSLGSGIRGNVVMDFLDFIYRSFAPEEWESWARRQWMALRESDEDEDRFDQIMIAFREAQFAVLKQNAVLISDIKTALNNSKDSIFSAPMEGEDRELLSYT